MTIHPQLGPVIMATLLTRDLAACARAYETYLHASIGIPSKVSAELAAHWQTPHLTGCSYVVLNNECGVPFLRIVEDPDCAVVNALKYTGWIALEIVVADVDTIAAGLHGSPFEVLRPVADLSLSAQIRAVQVRGPAGEILYLSQIKGRVPPFELPVAKCAVDKIFMPVLSTHNRTKSLAFYENLSGHSGIRFQAKNTVINQAYGWDIARTHPVACLQLNSESLIEINQVDKAQPAKDRPASGIMLVTFAVDTLPDFCDSIDHSEYTKRAAIMCGTAGEKIELVQDMP